MPGLFGDSGDAGGGVLGGLTRTLFPGFYAEGLRQQELQGMQQMNPGMSPQEAAFARDNPVAYQAQIQQRNLGATIGALQGMKGPNGQPLTQAQATYFALHPEVLSELAKPMQLEPGSTPWAGFNPFGGSTGGASAGGQTGIQGQPSQMPQPQQAQGMSGQLAPQNSSGVINAETARRAAEQWVLGDKDALQNAGFSKLGQIGRIAVQNEITNVMKEQGLTNEDIMQRQTRFPAVKKSVDKLYGAQASMGQAGIEFQKLFPQFVKDLTTYGATQYPDANKFFQYIDSHRGDPNVAPLAQRMITLSNVYGRAVSQNPQSANTDYKHREFAQALNQYWPLAATQRIGDAMNQEIQTAHDSVGKEVNRLFVDNGLGRKPDAQTLNDAKAALAKGNPKADVMQRLSEHGFTGDGL